MLDIAIGIAERGLAVDLILVRAEGPYLELLPPEVRLVDLAAQRALTSVPRLVRYLRRQRPSVLIATLPETSVIAMVAMKLVGVPVPLIVRRASNFTMEYASSGFKERMTLKIEKAMLPSATAVVVNSPGVAEDLNRRVPRASDRVRVIDNPVVWPDHLERAAMPVGHAWLEDPQTPVVLSASRLVSPKDHATLLRAFAEVATMRPARLVLLGDGPQRDDLTKLAEELRIAHVVDFAGFQINPIAYMSKAPFSFSHPNMKGPRMCSSRRWRVGRKWSAPIVLAVRGRYSRVAGGGGLFPWLTCTHLRRQSSLRSTIPLTPRN